MVDISGGSNWSSYRKSFTFYFKYFKRRKISGEMKSNFSFLSGFFFCLLQLLKLFEHTQNVNNIMHNCTAITYV